jgi:hypothetical protein
MNDDRVITLEDLSEGWESLAPVQAPIVHTTIDTHHGIYDLSGRPLAVPPVHGVYIVKGKKVMGR